MSNNRRPDRGGAPEKRRPPKKEISLWEAILLELRDRLRTLRLTISIDLEDLIRGVICGLLIILNAELQTTFFVRFAPFGAVPDLMLILTAAIGASEGEKFGAVCGLVSSFVIRSLGGAGELSLLPLLYFSAGYFVGILSKNYFSNTIPVKILYVAACCVGRAIISAICAASILSASFSQVMTDTVIPEFFSTALISPLVFFAVWLCYRKFHKSRDERTGV